MSLPKRWLLFLWVQLCCCLLVAQAQKEWIPEAYKLQLKYNPTALVTPNYPGLQVGAEHPLKGKMTMIHEFGIFRRFPTVFSDSDKTIHGFRGRTGIRWYPSGHYQNRTDFYISAWGQLKKEFQKDLNYIERFGGSYRELFEVKETRTYLGGFCTVGWQGPMSAISRWELDLGVGFRYRWTYVHPLPLDASEISGFNDFISFGEEFLLPDFFLAFTLDFRFNFLLK